MRQTIRDILARLRHFVQTLMKPLVTWWEQQSQRTRALPEYLQISILNFFQRGSSHAAALAYYAIFSIFPLTLLLAVGVSSLLGPTVGAEQITNALSLFLPGDTVELLQSNVTQAINQSESFTLIALLTLIWSGSGLFSNLSKILDQTFAAQRLRSVWRQRLVAIAMVLSLIVLIASSFLTSGILSFINVLLAESTSVWIRVGLALLPFGLNLVIFMLLFRYVPRIHVHWEAIIPAALFGAAGWELTKAGFGWYLDNLANFAVVYGSIATVIVLLLSAYITSVVLVLSAELCARLNEWIEAYQQPQTEVVLESKIPRLSRPTRFRGW